MLTKGDFLAIIEQAMDQTEPDDEPLFRGLLAAVVAYTDDWRARIEAATIHNIEADLEDRPDDIVSAGLAGDVGLVPTDFFTVNVLLEQFDGRDTRYLDQQHLARFREHLGRPAQ